MDAIDTIQRAFELAASGHYRNVPDIAETLSREGFQGAEAHLSGRSIRQQLRSLMSKAVGEEGRTALSGS